MAVDLSEQYDKIYRYCYCKLRHRESAEDTAQETFLRFFRAYPEREQTLPLLYTIARNLCADRYRRMQTCREELPETAEGEVSEENMDLLAALEMLSEEDRELILLRYVNEVPLGSLSKLYGVSRFSLYRRCERILSDLKRRMEE